MHLNDLSLINRSAWKKADVILPNFDRKEMCAQTKKTPIWVHFGAGNIFRGFIARLQQSLLNQGLSSCGIIAADTFDFDIIDKIYKPFDDMTLMVSLKPDGTTEKEIVASIAESLRAGFGFPEDIKRLKEIFKASSLQMVSFTITEKGYAITDIQGNFTPLVSADFSGGPEKCSHAMSLVTSLMWERYKAGAHPIALVSMDNCSHNGEKLYQSVTAIAEKWHKNGFVDDGFCKWLNNERYVSFPWSMIDKITPRPAKEVEAALSDAGIENMSPIVTSKNTYIAPFVNAEVPQYLVVEDKFPNGRPPLEKAGVYMTDRDTVNKVGRMKVTTCLNPLHTALAVYGCLLGYTSIAEEMKDPQLKALVERIGYDEGMPVVTDPKIISPLAFIKEVLEQRLPNPFIPDAPQRIATDTSQKVAIRFGETIKAYAQRPDLDVNSLTFIPLAIAGWLRYLLGIDDNGNPMEVSSDPMLEQLQQQLKGVELGRPESVENKLAPILSNTVLFGCDLMALGLGNKIEIMLREQLTGIQAVRNTLKKYLKN